MAQLGGVLTGTTVVDFGLNIAGPACASLLADLGADVIKVESPAGDTSRTLHRRPAASARCSPR